MKNGSPHYWLAYTLIVILFGVYAYIKDPGDLVNLSFLIVLALVCFIRWLYLLWKHRND